MFPTTIWTTIHHAGEHDPAALERFAERYRPAVLHYLNGRGFPGADGEDLCQEVFLRILQSGMLGRAQAERGRFRCYVSGVARHVVGERLRSRREVLDSELERVADRDSLERGFDQEWVLHLTERALRRMRAKSPGYHDVLHAHLSGRRVDRQKLWIARKKLAELVRDEVVQTCSGPEVLEEELTHVARILDSRRKI